jgi:hypothetical protein
MNSNVKIEANAGSYATINTNSLDQCYEECLKNPSCFALTISSSNSTCNLIVGNQYYTTPSSGWQSSLITQGIIKLNYSKN